MRTRRLGLFVFTLVVLFSVGACSADTADESSVTEETTVPTTESPVTTTKEPTPTLVPTPTPITVPEGYTYMMEHSSDWPTAGLWYLLSEQEVTVVDTLVTDGISPVEDGERIVLPAGTIAIPSDLTGDFSADLSEDTVFILIDGRCVVFGVSEGSDGSILFNGLAAEDLFEFRVNTYDYQEIPVIDEGDRYALDVADPTVTYRILRIHTDWNDDGVEDVFCRELTTDNVYVTTFTDGATGETTDVGQYCGSDMSGHGGMFTDSVYLYEDEAGNRLILDSFDICSSDFVTFVYSYDPDTILSYQEVGGSLTIMNDQIYLLRDSLIFGNGDSEILVPTVITDNTLIPQDIGSEIWWQDNLAAGDDSSAFPPIYTCTFKEFAAEKVIGDILSPITIPAGVAIFPLYTVIDESGAGVLYFRTVADGTCQVNFTYTGEWLGTKFGETLEDELFWCSYGD